MCISISDTRYVNFVIKMSRTKLQAKQKLIAFIFLIKQNNRLLTCLDKFKYKKINNNIVAKNRLLI